ncbi:hypothetical protein M422DRAFT_26976 [Sphaerobolus stellatus SS14]|nr:hypothetical protein M422DRAFT_26976 [Sphaerobolus stellatus SS14]
MDIQARRFTSNDTEHSIYQPPSGPQAAYPSPFRSPMPQLYSSIGGVPSGQFNMPPHQWNPQKGMDAQGYVQIGAVAQRRVNDVAVFSNIEPVEEATTGDFFEVGAINDDDPSANIEVGVAYPGGLVQFNPSQVNNSPSYSTPGMTPTSGQSSDSHEESAFGLQPMDEYDAEFQALRKELGLTDNDESIWQHTGGHDNILATLAPNGDPAAGSSGATDNKDKPTIPANAHAAQEL